MPFTGHAFLLIARYLLQGMSWYPSQGMPCYLIPFIGHVLVLNTFYRGCLSTLSSACFLPVTFYKACLNTFSRACLDIFSRACLDIFYRACLSTLRRACLHTYYLIRFTEHARFTGHALLPFVWHAVLLDTFYRACASTLYWGCLANSTLYRG